MAEGEDKDSKTEDPTEKKFRDAATKGNLPFSREITVFASTLAIYIYLVFYAKDGVSRVAESLKDLFGQPDQWQIRTGPDVLSIFIHLGWDASAVVMPVLLLMMVFGIGSSVLQNMPSPVLERIRPQWNRISPFAGFSRIFGMPGYVEFGKGLIKIVLVSIVMFFVLRQEYYRSLDAMFSEPIILFTKMGNNLAHIVLVILAATAVIGIGDFFWTRHHWFTELKMTKQEVKEESRQANGDPIVKARQRSIARDRARKRMMSEVPRATLVIANPTHFAVALRYVKEENNAPIVIAKGQDIVALRIREIAEENGIPVFEDPPLARSMFAQVSVDSVIPAVFYKAVAELIHRVYAAKSSAKRMR